MAGVEAPALAQQRADQTAMSVPRPSPQGVVAGLPSPLAPSDAARLRRVFELQARGETAAAARESERLADRRLMSHVLADRWLREESGAEPAELQAWLAQHGGDHPDAPAIHALLARRLPRGAALPPFAVPEQLARDAEVVPEERTPPARAVIRNPALDRDIRERAGRGDARGALAQIARTRGMTPAYAALLQAEVAQVLFRQGQDEEAYRIAAEAHRQAPGASGLAAHAAAKAEDAPPATRAAAAFWTARAAVRSRKPQLYVPWMMQAAQEPRTFYGQVARRALGLPNGFAFERELAGEGEAAAVAETAAGWRALALLQIGQPARAEAELRLLWPRVQNNPGVARAMLAVATQAGFTDLAAQLAGLVQSADGRPRDFARFPVPELRPRNGFRLDRALVYGLARQESNFDPGAVSPAGARGLMQLMPATASYIAGDPSLRDPAGMRRLHDPALSLELGQRYLLYLARHDTVQGDLIRMLAAYNSGPGGLGRWLPAAQHRDDPFLFIEAIPVDETRLYVQRVLAYSWIYAARLGLPAPSLDALAAGNFPKASVGEEMAVAPTAARGRVTTASR